jgi:hypothetical protein
MQNAVAGPVTMVGCGGLGKGIRFGLWWVGGYKE